ncbi:ROK family protein [Dactylosporangium sp. NPDC050588]|uniref:ROK family protein n=1 Tax=Dactylosporangium sp. NPDC050588 TaxID=3157211 RepID=UPI0033D4ED4D
MSEVQPVSGPSAPGGANRPKMAAARLVTLLHRHGPITRSQATEQLGLARSAVGTALEELAALGVARLSEKAQTGSTRGRGRPSPVIEIHPDGPTVFAAYVRPDRIIHATVGLGQRMLDLSWDPLDAAAVVPETLARRLADLAIGVMRRQRCVAVSVALSATVREADGYVPSSLHLGWTDVPFAQLLRAHLPANLPVTIHRGSGLAALAEYRYGAGRGAADLLALNCEHAGIGGGFVTGGDLFAGSGYAIEAGHITIEPNGRQCLCGARGCLEMYADGRALLRAANVNADPRGDLTGQTADVLANAAAGSPAAIQAIETTARYLAAGLVGLVNTLSPERIVLNGLLAKVHHAASRLIIDELSRSSIVARTGRVTICTGTLAHPTLLGAADKAFEPLLDDPWTALRPVSPAEQDHPRR